VIIKSPTITLDFTGASPVDISDYVISAQLDVAHSAVDDRTFGAPHASDAVSGMHQVTLLMRWSDALAAAFDTYTDTDIDMLLTPEASGGTIGATVRYAKAPLPDEVKIGEQAECTLVLAVVDEVDWTAAP